VQREQAAKSAFQAGVEAAEAGDYARARDLFLRSRELMVKASTLLNLAVADLKLGLAEEALAALDALDAENPEQNRLRERARVLRLEAEQLRARDAEPSPNLMPALEVASPTAAAAPSAALPVVPSAPPPALGPPRALLIAGGALTAGAIGGALWWSDRSQAVDECHKREMQCLEHAQIERQERAAMAMTLTLATAGLGLLTGGAVWFAQRKHDQRTHAYVSAWGFKGSAGALLRTTF
jgi:hypothetical protein